MNDGAAFEAETCEYLSFYTEKHARVKQYNLVINFGDEKLYLLVDTNYVKANLKMFKNMFITN